MVYRLVVLFSLLSAIQIYGQETSTTKKILSNDYINQGLENQIFSIRQIVEMDQEALSRTNFSNRDSLKVKEEGEILLNLDVYFYVLSSNEEDKLTEKEIQTQLDALNRDFGQPESSFPFEVKEHQAFDALAGNPNIQFSLAGIQFYESKESSWIADDAIKKQFAANDPSKYINIWIGRLEEDISGYATMPLVKSELDGIVMDSRWIKQIGDEQYKNNQGKMLTHLMGNYLGLYSIWGLAPCTDDGVEDTPIINTPSQGCSDIEYISLCGKARTIDVGNFMDTADDPCQTHFTKGQVERMRSFLLPGGQRHSLVENQFK